MQRPQWGDMTLVARNFTAFWQTLSAMLTAVHSTDLLFNQYREFAPDTIGIRNTHMVTAKTRCWLIDKQLGGTTERRVKYYVPEIAIYIQFSAILLK